MIYELLMVVIYAHNFKGNRILKPISFLVRSHHEQVNGRDYSDGLKGEKIPYQKLNPA
ncbi:MAG: hypothetical protein QNK40_16565 [Desulfobacterales bacterium]|nr:hypothetical protein [Desulfobacterales bacterium]MDX2510407.1 hypothetical protein [Desulfobacterales bacterium]